MKGAFAKPRAYWLVAAAAFLCAAAAAAFVPQFRETAALMQCKVYGGANAQAECVFELIKERLLDEGITAAVGLFERASMLYLDRLDVDCHASTHRVGDMVYYNLLIANPDVSQYEFPPAARMCNRGFFHGVFEHLFQDRPDPQFIVQTCNYFRDDTDVARNAVGQTCFHAAGHGLFRSQAEQVSKSDWGKPEAFVAPGVAICNSLPGVEDKERYTCMTGVESIYIQSSLRGDYGLSNPTLWNTMGVCDQLSERFRSSCYFVRAIMVAEIADGYDKVLDDCFFSSDALFDSCMRGTITGLLVNGVNDHSYGNVLSLCEDSRVAHHSLRAVCYEQAISQLAVEYKGGYSLACARFPEVYRSQCAALSTRT